MAKNEVIDVLIIGGGIAAHTAALYNSRASLNVLVISAPELDQLSLTSTVENYPGFPKGIMGPELIQNAKAQAQRFGAKYEMGKVDSFTVGKSLHTVGVGDKNYKAKSVIIATGASARTLDVPGKKEYFGKGISTCAVCDAALYRGKDTIIIGGGDSAMEEGLALSKFSDKVTVIHRKDTFRASKIMQDRLLKNNKIKVEWNTELVEVLGDGKFVSGAKLKNNKTGKVTEIKCKGVFFAIGHTPNVGFLKGQLKTDKLGYLITDKRTRTNVPGIFAAGDVQDPVFRQAVTSAGAGCMAALSAEWHVEGINR